MGQQNSRYSSSQLTCSFHHRQFLSPHPLISFSRDARVYRCVFIPPSVADAHKATQPESRFVVFLAHHKLMPSDNSVRITARYLFHEKYVFDSEFGNFQIFT